MAAANTSMSSATGELRKKAKKVGRQIRTAVDEAPEIISLERNDRALRSEMSEIYEKIGKRVMSVYRKRGDDSPFARYKGIRSELLKLEGIESEFEDNKNRLDNAKKRVKKGGRTGRKER